MLGLVLGEVDLEAVFVWSIANVYLRLRSLGEFIGAEEQNFAKLVITNNIKSYCSSWNTDWWSVNSS